MGTRSQSDRSRQHETVSSLSVRQHSVRAQSFAPLLGALCMLSAIGCGKVTPSMTFEDVAPAPDHGPITTEDSGSADPDASPTADAATSDSAPEAANNNNDSATGDASSDAAVIVDAAPVDAGPGIDPCSAGAVIDFNASAHAVSGSLVYNGRTESSPMIRSTPGSCVDSVVQQVAHKYTVTNRSHLMISTNNSQTDSSFDTVVWILDECDPTQGVELGCNDDVAPAQNRSAFTTTNAIEAGTTVYIMVAGYNPARQGLSSTGGYALSITEVPEAQEGEACDPQGNANYCVSTSHCLTDRASPTCVRDGSLNGRCEESLPACDDGLICNFDRLSPTSRCVNAVPPGSQCDPHGRENMCETGLYCLYNGSSFSCS